MKKKLLLFLSKYGNPANCVIASTLAWLSKSNNYLFDNYYDNYSHGIHFPGGDFRHLEMDQLGGGTVSGDRHFEEFYFLLHNFDVSIISFGDSIFLSNLENLNIPVLKLSEHSGDIYKNIFDYLDSSFPSDIVMIGSDFNKELSGLHAYLYPEIYFRRALGVLDSISDDELAGLYRKGSKISCFYVNEKNVSRLHNNRYDVEIVDNIFKEDDYLSITKRIVLRWKEKVKGWILGDPTLVSYWIPKACEENLFPIYGIPQEKVISELSNLISSKGNVVYGRQYSDRDFFELSKLNQCLQVIDPCRPPFQSIKHAEYTWHTNQDQEGFYEPEYSDEQLRQFGRDGRILISLMFWSGMIREIANFYNLMDLFAIAGLKCGLVLTAESYEYMMHSPLELITIPLEQGGVYPLVEPVLGSCGIGVGIESYIDKDRLQDAILDSLSRISFKTKKKNFMPRGWWTTMDTDLKRLARRDSPKLIRFLKYPPYFQIRFNAVDKKYKGKPETSDVKSTYSIPSQLLDKLKETIRNAGLIKYFEAYRPYEFYQPGSIRTDVIETAQAAGFEYMFTKAGFNDEPKIKYLNDNFIAMNYTAGQWDGWTPFETINDVSDLRTSEKKLLKRKKPGWIVSTIDSCLWTFSGEFWKRGSRLFDIAQFCSNGGSSGKLINVKPFTISRYARIIAEENK